MVGLTRCCLRIVAGATPAAIKAGMLHLVTDAYAPRGIRNSSFRRLRPPAWVPPRAGAIHFNVVEELRHFMHIGSPRSGEPLNYLALAN